MSNHKFPWGRTFLIGFGFLGISIIWPIFNQYIPLFLQHGNPEYVAQLAAEGRTLPELPGGGLGLAPALAMFIMTWDNLINIFVQPWVGAKSDRTWNRFGRRKMWIMIGAPIAVLGFILLPVAQSVIAIMVFILITNFGMALFRSPTVAWLGDLFINADRSKANGVINLMGGVGGLIAYFGGGLLFKSLGREAPFIGGAIAMLLALSVCLLLVKEPPKVEASNEEKTSTWKNLKSVVASKDKSGLYVLFSILFWFIGFNAVETGLSSFAYFELSIDPGTSSMLASAVNISFMIFAIPGGLVAGKFGRRKTILFGLSGILLLFPLGFFLVTGMATYIIFLVLTGFFWAMINVNSLPMVYDFGGERSIGASTGLYYFFSQTAAVLGPVMGGLLVQSMGNQYRWLLIFATVFMACAWFTMSRVKERRMQKVGEVA
ncbi:MAG TPA: MFS transporter [Anaerolineaceae bacterium]|nr:MFS transporter [Anaerolineaceae bacterium]